jgi:hypothetical protein
MTGIDELINALEKTPDSIAKLVADLSQTDLRRKGADGEFSAIENVCHLRDIEIEGYTSRINRILNESEPFLPDIDGGRLAIERHYSEQNPHQALQAFAEARKQNIQTLSSVSSEQLEREAIMEGVGRLPLAKLLLMMREHDESHIRDLHAIREQFRDPQ